jgi:uncharacterized protein YjlB
MRARPRGTFLSFRGPFVLCPAGSSLDMLRALERFLRRTLEPMTQPVQPERVFFKDDGSIPNSKFPLLVYRQAFSPNTRDLPTKIEEQLTGNSWIASWRSTVFPFHHYHSTSHEALGVYRGSATLRLGGDSGKNFPVSAGDVIVIPAGVGHKRLESTEDFGVVGAYPGGRRWDVLRGLPGERLQADRHIAEVPLPVTDPVYGRDGPLVKIWGNLA